MTGTSDDPLDAIVARVLASRRYRNVAPALVRRIAAEELPKAGSPAETEKRVKRRLHQIFGAYATRTDYAGILARLQTAASDRDKLRQVCREALGAHASTRERLPIVERFYAEVFAVTGRPASLLDLGCGLNPLAIPWMDLAPDCPYHAVDIDLELVAFLADALPLLGVAGQSEARDVVASAPEEAVDVALLLKTIPCLEQQRAGIGRDLLGTLAARRIVVTYPTRSLGGHGKGMARTYREQFARIADSLEREYTTLELPGELAFVLPGASVSPTAPR